MNGTHSETMHSTIGPGGEDLDVVLSRFKSWASTQRPAAGKLTRDAREISYEQALKASGYRRSANLASDSESVEAQVKSPFSHEGQPQSASEKRVAAARAAIVTPASPVLRKTQLEPKPEPAAVAPPPAVQRGAGNGAAIRARKPRNARAAKTASQPAFRDVLEGTAALTASHDNAAAPLDRAKSQSITLRVSDAEQARIQACAAQANLSVSAYLRQCALGVDELREQIRVAIATMKLPSAEPAPQPGLAAIPGILGRCIGRFIPWHGKNSDNYSATAIRG